MNQLPEALRAMYLRDLAQLPSDKELDGYITYSEVLRGYYYMVDYFTQLDGNEKMLPGLRPGDLLSPAVARQATSFGGRPKWPDAMHSAVSDQRRRDEARDAA